MTKRIILDASLQSRLDWSDSLQQANNETGILWELDLGISKLDHPLENEMQFRSLCLSLQHFRDAAFDQYREKTEAVCLYRGTPDFSSGFHWSPQQRASLQEWMEQVFINPAILSQEIGLDSFEAATPEMLKTSEEGRRLLALFCRDAMAEYFELLSATLPEDVEIRLDFEAIEEPMLLAELTCRDCYRNFTLLEPLSDPDASKGICMPAMPNYRPSQLRPLKRLVQEWTESGVAFRVIPEGWITMSWHGLDELAAAPDAVSSQGKRMLQGFEAAGGSVRSLP